MNPALWYLLVVIAGALFGFAFGACMDLVERRRWRRALTVDNIVNYRHSDDGA